MGVLEHVDILGDSLELEVVALHFVMQRQEAKSVPAGAPRLEVREDLFWSDLGVQGVTVP